MVTPDAATINAPAGMVTVVPVGISIGALIVAPSPSGPAFPDGGAAPPEEHPATTEIIKAQVRQRMR
jgi:hypothetical protein